VIGRRWISAAVAAAVVGAAAGPGRAGRVCDLAFSECPGRFSNGIVKVPEELIWLDAKIPFCNEYVRIADGAAKPPSIIFIIDNSGSMDENDPDVARFNVVSTLLDNIHAFAPGAEVGLVIFTRRLAFDHRENAFFKTAFPSDTAQHDSYVPLTALNQRFADGRSGLDTLKALLKHDKRGNLTYVTRLPASRNNSGMGRANTRDGTDISLGFQAAKAAMKDSKSDKSGQFFVFLSDGTPSTPDIGREGMLNEFIAGASTPSTFTVYFDTQNSTPVAPGTIVAMTANIKANMYSATNPKSAYWAITTPGSQLQGLLQTQVIGNVLSVPALPRSASLAMGDVTVLNAGRDDSGFLFSKRLALREDTTRIRLEYTYAYVDTTGGAEIAREKKVPYALAFVRAAGVPLPQGMAENCKEQAGISLYRDGLPITAVTAEDAILEARLTLPDGSLCKGCKMEVMPSTPRVQDREPLILAPGPGYSGGVFRREVNLTPTPGDGRLQHLPGDSIVVLFVSPENPLDRVRKAFAYADAPTVLKVGPQNGYARTRFALPTPEPQFLLVAPPGLQPSPMDATDHWRMIAGPMAPPDSLRYVGVTVEASRAFTVDLLVFTNLGAFVNKVAFTVNPAEFQKLDKGAPGGARLLKVLWDTRSRNGAMAGTGAYVIKTTVRLMKIPGIAEDDRVRTDYRRVGVLRSL
jgi:hypothetical protein